jgi:RHS repeat-associated protein
LIIVRWVLLAAGSLASLATQAAWTVRPEPGLAAMALTGEPQAITLAAGARLAAVAMRESKAVAFVDVDSGTRLGTMVLGRKPIALAFDAAATRLYVLSEESNQLAVIDVASRTLSATWTLGVEPAALAFDAAHGELLVADREQKKLRALAPATGAELRSLTLDFSPRQLVLSPDAQRLVIGGKGLLATLDAGSWNEINRVSVGDDIRSLAWWDFGALALAVSKQQDALNLVDAETGTITAHIALDGDPDAVAVSQSEDRAFVSTREDLSVNRVELGSRALAGRYALPGKAGAVAFDPLTRVLYITQPKDELLLKLDPAQASLIGVLTLNKRLRDIAVNDVTHEAVAIADKSDELSRIKLTDRSVQTVALPATPQFVAVDTGLNRAVVSLRKAREEIAFVDLSGATPSVYPERIDFPDEISAIAVDPTRALTVALTKGSQRIHFVDNASRGVVASLSSSEKFTAAAVQSGRGIAYLVAEDKRLLLLDLDGHTLTQTLSLSFKVDGIAVDEALDRAVLTTAKNDRAWVLDLATLTFVTSFALPRNPGEVAIQRQTHTAVVTSKESGAVSLIDLATLQATPGFSSVSKPSRLAVTSRYNQAWVLSAERDEIAIVQLVNPVPVLNQVVPTQVSAGTPAMSLMLHGAHFIDGAVAYFGATPLVTRWQNHALLYADVPENLLAAATSVPITVLHPGPGGGTSNALTFQVLGAPPLLQSVAPPALVASGEAQLVTVTGAYFTPDAQILFGTQPLATEYLSQTQLRASVPGGLLTAPGSAAVSVVSPAGQSNSLPVTIESAAPLIDSIAPSQGDVGTLVTIGGRGFYVNPADNQVRFSGDAEAPVLTATLTQLTVKVPATALTGPISVTTPRGTAVSAPFSVTRVQDFALVVSPAQVRLLQSARANAAVELASLGSEPFTGLASLSVTGVPAGVTAELKSTHLSATQSATLMLAAGAAAAPGTYSVSVHGGALVSGLIQTRSATFELIVEPAGGITGVAGRFVTPEGRGIAGVIVRADTGQATQPQTVTDAAGNFLLTGLPAGELTLRLDATPAHPLYPIWPATLTLAAGSVTALDEWVLIAPPPDERFTPIDNATQDQQITDPRYPGLAITLPAGVQIVGWDGVVKTRIAVERVEFKDMGLPPPPFQMKEAYQLFFGTPMGGIPSAPIPITLPNVAEAEPGEELDIWYFDGSPMGGTGTWKVAGKGVVGPDGRSVSTKPGEGLPRFCGKCGYAALGCPDPPRPPPQTCPPQKGGNPVDLYAGQEMPSTSGLRCGGLTPIDTGLSYNPVDAFGGRAGTIASFGFGWTSDYDIALLPFTGVQKRLILPGGIEINFVDRGDGVYLPADGQRLPGAQLRAIPELPPGRYEVRLKDGQVWRFAPFPGIPGLIRGGPPTFLVEIVDPQGNTLSITRQSNGRIVSVGSPQRNVSMSYGANGFVAQMTDSAGRSMQFTYNADGRIDTRTDAEGKVTAYTYVGDDEIAPDPVCGPQVERGKRIKTVLYPGRPNPTENFYGVSRRVLRQIGYDGREFRFAYKVTGACVTHVNQPGVQCTGPQCPSEDSWHHFQAGWRIHGGQVVATRTTHPDASNTEVRFDAKGATLASSDALGQETRRTLDADHRVIARTDVLGRTWRYEYDANGNRTRTIDPLGRSLDIVYDPVWNKPTALTRYDDQGSAQTYEFSYDPQQGTLLSRRDPLNHLTGYTYTPRGQLESITDPLGHVTAFEYNEHGDLIVVSDGLGNRTLMEPDPVGRPSITSDPLNRTRLVEYNGVDQMAQSTDPLGGVTRYTYDQAQRLASVIDPNGNPVQRYAYDDRDRLEGVTDALERSETYAYDAKNRLAQLTDRKGQVITYAYDARDRITQITRPDGAETRRYDAVGRLIQLEDGNSRIEYAYDLVDRLVRETQTHGGVSTVVEYAYDALDRRVRRTVNGGDTTEYGYDLADRLTEIRYRNQITRYTWDDASRLTSKTLPNGIQVAYAYDDADRLTQIAYRTTDGGLIEQIDYTYDAAGQRIGRTALNRLDHPETAFAAVYDTANRMTQVTLLPNKPNAKTYSLSYDDNGNLAGKQNTNDAADLTTYTWDARDRLIGIEASGISASFAYDALGRRIARTVNGQTTTYVYDGAQAIAETTNGIERDLLTGLAIDEMIARYSDQGERTYLTDALGSVIALAREDEGVVNTYAYSPYGESASSADDEGNSSEYTARENDGTGLYFYRARYYDPVLKRFVAEDPIGLAGGDANLYAYVGGNPVQYADSTGLARSSGGATSAGPSGPPNCPDPCTVLQEAIDEVVEELKERYWDMYFDKCNLYNLAPYRPNPDLRPGCNTTTWIGHQEQFIYKQRQLQRLIKQAIELGCPYDPEADTWSRVFPPVLPGDHMDPRIPTQ